MHRSLRGRTISTAFSTAGVAVPSGTAAFIILHAVIAGSVSQTAIPVSPPGRSIAVVRPPTPVPPLTAPAPLTSRAPGFQVNDHRRTEPHGSDDHGHR
jgi:hypothetical protein